MFRDLAKVILIADCNFAAEDLVSSFRAKRFLRISEFSHSTPSSEPKKCKLSKSFYECFSTFIIFSSYRYKQPYFAFYRSLRAAYPFRPSFRSFLSLILASFRRLQCPISKFRPSFHLSILIDQRKNTKPLMRFPKNFQLGPSIYRTDSGMI